MPGRPLPACRRRRPRWVRISARPLASRPPWPSGCTKPWAPRMSVISWLPLLRPTRLRASASTTPLPRPPPGSLPVWVGSPLTGRVSHPLDDKQSFMMSSHHHSPLTSLAWSHRAPTPVAGAMQQRRDPVSWAAPTLDTSPMRRNHSAVAVHRPPERNPSCVLTSAPAPRPLHPCEHNARRNW